MGKEDKKESRSKRGRNARKRIEMWARIRDASDPQQPVLDSASRSGHRRSLRTKELHLAWRCKLGTEAPRGEEAGK